MYHCCMETTEKRKSQALAKKKENIYFLLRWGYANLMLPNILIKIPLISRPLLI